jgi:acyl-CoA synthetase (AMP-forming)/AMP-acid ligase II
VDIAIVPFCEAPIPIWKESLRQPPFVKGEIAVRAAWVTEEYFGKRDATKRAKILSESGVWHRMGDVGYLDDRGALWFCGRKDHRILSRDVTLFPDPIEAIFDSHPQVIRSALVGVGVPGRQRPILVVQVRRRSRRLAEDLKAYAAKYRCAQNLEGIAFRKYFPVDVRHNIKIDRLRLARSIEGDFR